MASMRNLFSVSTAALLETPGCSIRSVQIYLARDKLCVQKVSSVHCSALIWQPWPPARPVLAVLEGKATPGLE